MQASHTGLLQPYPLSLSYPHTHPPTPALSREQRHATVVPVSVHSCLGTIVCMAMIAQISFGIEKLDHLRAPRVERAGGGIHRHEPILTATLHRRSMVADQAELTSPGLVGPCVWGSVWDRWHGRAGMLLYDIVILTVLTGEATTIPTACRQGP